LTFYTLLGFAKKSKKLVSGMTNCLYAIRKKKARLVIITEDAGINRKKVVRECQSQDIPFVGTVAHFQSPLKTLALF
jgi:ribosomal protein L7Ae-like RNA K-turn-binding protein